MNSPYKPTASPKQPNCQACGLYRTCHSPFMRGQGPAPSSPDAKEPYVLVIGEQPAGYEDKNDRPFDPGGKSGKLIRRTLSDYSVKYNITFTNALRCASPYGVKPPIKKFRYCNQYLMEEIETVRPDFILILGGKAFNSIFKKGSITKNRRQPLEVTLQDGTVIPAMAAYHPAYALHELNHMSAFKKDIKTFCDFVHGKKAKNADVFALIKGANLDASAEDIAAFHRYVVENDRLTSLDFETNALDVRNRPPDFRISAVGFSDDVQTLTCLLDTKTKKMDKAKRKAIRALLLDPLARKVCHNGKYELHCANARLSISEIPNIVMDTLLLHAFLFPIRMEHDLKSVAEEMLGVSDYERPLRELLKVHDGDWMHPAVLAAIPQYNAMDNKCTIGIAYKLIKLLCKEDERFAALKKGRGIPPSKTFYEIVVPTMYAMFEAEKNGWPIDAEVGRKVAAELEKDAEALLREIRRMPTVRRFEQQQIEDYLNGPKCAKTEKGQANAVARIRFNPKSPQQLSQILYGRKFFRIPTDNAKKTGSGEQYSADKETRQNIIDSGFSITANKFLTVIDKWLDVTHEISNFINSMLVRICDDGRVRADFRLDISASRVSSKDPNLHNLKKSDDAGEASKARSIVSMPPGRMLLEADLSQIELRVLAMETGDEGLVDIYKHGHDLHDETARSVVGGVEEGEETPDHIRRKAKTINFGIAYRISAYGLQAKLDGTTVEECMDYIDNWYDRFPGVRTWQEQVELFTQRYGFVYTLFGRKRILKNCQIRNPSDEERSLVAHAMRQATNFPIQGCAMDIMLVSIIKLRKLIRKYDIDAKFINSIHDSILFDVAEEDTARLASLAYQVMTREPIRWIKPWLRGIPLDVDVKAGKNWVCMEKIECKTKTA